MLGVSKHLARAAVRQCCIANNNTSKSKSTFTFVPPTQPKLITESLKFQKLQAQLQKHDEKPIFLKDGGSSRNLYLTTLGLCGLGLLSNITYEKKEPIIYTN